jgi:hypothetical protein
MGLNIKNRALAVSCFKQGISGPKLEDYEKSYVDSAALPVLIESPFDNWSHKDRDKLARNIFNKLFLGLHPNKFIRFFGLMISRILPVALIKLELKRLNFIMENY